jgi:hypothetical protein
LTELEFLLSEVKYMETQINEKGFTGCAACINMPRNKNTVKATTALNLTHGRN